MLKQYQKAGLWIQCKRAFLARQTNLYGVNVKSIRHASSKNNNEDDLDKPIQYSSSPAATWTAAKSRNPLLDRHPYESTVLTISLAVFMLYFFVLREENDIDLIFSADLSERIPGLNIKQPMSYSK